MITCNQIGIETRNAKVWDDFPADAVAIEKNGYGDLIMRLPDKNHKGMLEDVYLWERETGKGVEFAKNIHQIKSHYLQQE